MLRVTVLFLDDIRVLYKHATITNTSEAAAASVRILCRLFHGPSNLILIAFISSAPADARSNLSSRLLSGTLPKMVMPKKVPIAYNAVADSKTPESRVTSVMPVGAQWQ